jgi:hypothetical protein
MKWHHTGPGCLAFPDFKFEFGPGIGACELPSIEAARA